MEQSLGTSGDRIPTGARSVMVRYQDVPAPQPTAHEVVDRPHRLCRNPDISPEGSRIPQRSGLKDSRNHTFEALYSSIA
jgi:hypothetical protein